MVPECPDGSDVPAFVSVETGLVNEVGTDRDRRSFERLRPMSMRRRSAWRSARSAASTLTMPMLDRRLCWLFLANDFVAVEVGNRGGREQGGGCSGSDGECEQCAERSEGDGGSGVGELEVGVAADEGGHAGEHE